VARLVRRRQQEQPLRVRRQPPHTPHEQVFELLTHGQRIGRWFQPTQLLRGQLVGGFDDGERIATGLATPASIGRLIDVLRSS
jgi:hypothetical protein